MAVNRFEWYGAVKNWVDWPAYQVSGYIEVKKQTQYSLERIVACDLPG
jgi:hypothetical protein